MEQKNKFAIIGLILAIISLIISWVPLVGLILAITSLILCIIGTKGKDMGMAIAGIVCSSVAIIIGMIITLALLFFVGTWPNIKEDMFEQTCEREGYYNAYTKCCTSYDGSITCLEDYDLNRE